MVKRTRVGPRPRSIVVATSQRSPVLLPPEISAIICEMVADKRALLILCQVSSFFRCQAQRLLYRSVHLSEGGPAGLRRLKSWVNAASKHAHLAEYVHSLALRLPPILEASIATKLARALAQCTNLKELSVSGPKSTHGYSCFQGSMLNKTSFRLKKFVNRYFDDRLIMEFWRNQTELRILDIKINVCALDPDSMLLPNLIAVKTNNIGDLPVGRALESIQTYPMADILLLKQYETSLTTLNLWQQPRQRHWLQQPQELVLDTLVGLVAGTLPNLLHLGLFAETKGFEIHNSSIHKAVLERFNRLDSFTLQLPYVANFYVGGVSQKHRSLTKSTGVFDVGRDIMTACPTLRRVAISVKVLQVYGGVLTRSDSDGAVQEERKTWLEVRELSSF
ncbi:hypothetical protein R3P38DRAFT_2678681 [Favolaschia claudopus]|uniref:F-box domain-containing protein n=1 Tax=Favolaschia claudopus TaxID=2862362 RepID=A0AAW0EEC9_9AGAR